jgi:hypothetical protein
MIRDIVPHPVVEDAAAGLLPTGAGGTPQILGRRRRQRATLVTGAGRGRRPGYPRPRGHGAKPRSALGRMATDGQGVMPGL